MLRAPSLLLCLSLLLPACGESGGVTTDSTDSTDSTMNTSDSAPTEVTGSSSDTGATIEPTTTEDASSTGDSSTTGPGTETDTEAVEPTTGTTGEPDPCADLVAPEPANEFVKFTELIHFPLDDRFLLTLRGYEGTNEWDVQIELGAEEPVMATLTEHPFSAQELLGMAGGGTEGTLTLEIVEVTPECLVGRISEIVEMQESFFILDELPGGFVAARRTFAGAIAGGPGRRL